MPPLIKRLLLLPAILLLLSCGSGKNFIQQLENDYVQVQGSQPWVAGIMVYDPAAKNVILQHNSHKYFIPASTAKLFTFYVGLKYLEDSIPALKYEVFNDTLFFSGTGDPTLLHENFNSSKILNFLDSRPETLALVSTEATENALGAGWTWDDYNFSFSAERSELPVYGNVVSFKSFRKNSLQVIPPYFQNYLKVDRSNSTSHIYRLQQENLFKIPIFETTSLEQDVPFITSAKLTAQLLQDTLKRKVFLKNAFPKKTVQQKLFSHPADSLYKKMLQESDNFFAEQLLLLAAGEISDTLRTKIAINRARKDILRELPDEIKWVDGSGLSRYNLFTPRSMVWVLEKIYEEVPHERLFALLPAGGVSGTLMNDYKAPKGKPPFVFGKTGTLSNNHSLSGYLVTASGKVLIFSFMNNNYLVPTAVVKSEIDRVLREIYFNY